MTDMDAAERAFTVLYQLTAFSAEGKTQLSHEYMEDQFRQAHEEGRQAGLEEVAQYVDTAWPDDMGLARVIRGMKDKPEGGQ